MRYTRDKGARIFDMTPNSRYGCVLVIYTCVCVCVCVCTYVYIYVLMHNKYDNVLYHI